MAIEQVGSEIVIRHAGTTPVIESTATGTAAITVPATTTMLHLGLTAFVGVANQLSSDGIFDINGNTSIAATGGASNAGAIMSTSHYILNPAIGSVNLDWQWGSALDASSVWCVITFWKGVDLVSPTRDLDNGAVSPASDTVTSGTYTAQSGDLIIAHGGTQDDSNGNLTFTWSGATELVAEVPDSEFDGSIATASPTGNQTVGFTATGAEQCAVSAFVFKAAAESNPEIFAWAPVVRAVRGSTFKTVTSGMTPPSDPD